MAKQLKVTIVDDLTGAEIAEGAATEKRKLTWKGKQYELDLTPESAAKVDAALEKILANVPAAGSASVKGSSTKRSSGEATKIREWAREQGMEVSERGRISAEVQAAYRAGHANNTEAPQPQPVPVPA